MSTDQAAGLELLSDIEFFSVFSDSEQEQVLQNATTLNFNFGEPIINAGDPAEGLYIIQKGTVRLFTSENGKETSLGVRKKGRIFSELAALRPVDHEYSVRASAKTELLFIPRDVLLPIIQSNPDNENFVTRYVAISAAGGLVSQLFNLKGKVDPAENEEFIRSIGIKRVKQGDVIIAQENTEDKRLYVIRQGSVGLVRKEEGDEYPLATLGPGDVFGEKAALLYQEQPATVTAKKDTILLIIPQDTIRFVLEKNPDIKPVLEERIHFYNREVERQKKLAELRGKPLLFDFASKPKAGENVIKRFQLIEQAEEMDCGAACLAMICKQYGIQISRGKLRELANVTTEGATLESLARVGESLGFTTQGVQCTYNVLLGFDLPFIAHWEGYHYIVIYGVSKSHVWIADPAVGFRKLTVEEFEKGWSGNCLVFKPGPDLAEIEASRSPWLRFVGFLTPFKKILVHLFIATLVIEILGLGPPIIIQNILDGVVVHQNFSLLNLLIIGLVLAQLFTQITTLLRTFLTTYLIRNMDFAMMTYFFKHTLSLPIAFFNKRKTGDIMARFQENETIRDFLTETTISTILNVMMVFLYLTVMFIYNVKMTMLLLAFIVPIMMLTVIATPRMKDYARQSFEASADAESALIETIGASETVKGMGIERAMRLKWEKKYAKSLDIQYRSDRYNAIIGMISQLLNAAASAAILWVGASLVLKQELSIGQLMAFNMLMGSVMSPLLGLIGLWDEIHEAGVSMERLGDVLDMDPEQKPDDMASRIALPDFQGAIQLQNVYFRYAETKDTPYVLENISCSINPGELVAIVGQSGSGKTTLAKLLVGFYPPSEGTIYVDGYDINLVDKEFFRKNIGYVMQSNLLFSGTVSENIAIGDENPDHRRIIEAAKMADAHGFINSLPLGYEQVVGERGTGLSGGQVQRICIARSLYHNPRLLIFDEATSALDTQSESNILSNMQDILEGRTAVVIAHRLSTIMKADKILVLYEGGIVEEGRHDELLANKGMYYQLVQKQISE